MRPPENKAAPLRFIGMVYTARMTLYNTQIISLSTHNEKATEQGPSPSAKDADEPAAISIQPNLQERTDTSSTRHTRSGSPSTVNISKSNTIRCLSNGDEVRAEQQNPKAGRDHREPPK